MFVALSSILYLILAAVGIFAFSWSLNDALDHQLRLLASELGHAIDLDKANSPHFRDWLRVVQTEPARSLAAIQLYGSNEELLEHYGPPGPIGLIKERNETQHFRLIVSPLKRNSEVVGYFQIALPTNYRDDAQQKLEITVALLAPILLLGLGLTS